MSFSTFISSGVNSIVAAKNSFVSLPLSRKIAAGYAVLHVATMKKAYKRAVARTQGKGLKRHLIVGAKTLAGPWYILGSIAAVVIKARRSNPKVKAKKASAKKFDLKALNHDLASIRGGKSLKSLDRQYTQGMAVLKKHNAPARLIKSFNAGFKQIRATVKAKASLLTPAAAKHSANKFSKKAVVAPVTPVTATVPAK